MLTSLAKDNVAMLAREDGTTLIELLVTILCGVVVIMALFTIMDTTLDQGTRVFSRIDANQQARAKLEQLENLLHSACVSSEVEPILSSSTPDSLAFFSAYGNAAAPTPSEYVFTYNSSTHSITWSEYPEASETSGTPDSWTFGTTATSSGTLVSNVYPLNSSTPIFEYFDYQTITNPTGGATYSDPEGNDYEIIPDGLNTVPNNTYVPPANPQLATSASTTSTLGTSASAQTAEVLVSFKVGASGGSLENTNTSSANGNDAVQSVQDAVVLRLTDPSNHQGPGAYYGPCD
jgi:hypothetical protein